MLKRSRLFRILRLIACGLFVIAIPTLLVSATVHYAATSERLYNYDFNRYHIDEVTGIDRAELSRVAHEMIQYYGSDDKKINIRIKTNLMMIMS